jgi:predicted AlkP superfamily phosphohydrolase/phosphomutase
LKGRCFVLGLDCLGPEVIASRSLAELPNLRRLVEEGLSGPLESTLPPITVPAWTSMMTGRDPGELGIYGFKNRRSYAYGDLFFATSGMVRFPRVWDLVGAAGGRSIVVGVPQTSPPPVIEGVLVSGFEAEGADLADGGTFAHPPQLAEEIRGLIGDYIFDVTEFRQRPREAVRATAWRMTELRFRLMEHLLATRDWDFAMLCEIAPDRLHHCFWSDHDPLHHRHRPGSPYADVIRSYYRFVDGWIGRLRERLPPGCPLLVVSDHGARAMEGGVCVNEVLRRAGWLALREEPAETGPLRPQQVDWSRTRAWGEGGYYARIFLNVEGREPQGILPYERRDEAREELAELLGSLALPGGPTLANRVIWPERAYRAVRGLAPDLIVLFADLGWRSLGTIGHRQLWLQGNDTGVDEANHAQDGLYVLASTGAPRGWRRASILDVAPTVLEILGVAAPDGLTGRSFVAERRGRSERSAPWKSSSPA